MLDYPVNLLARVLDARQTRDSDQKVRRACTDSREVEAGDLFVALPGERTDGHNHLSEAFERGAVAALVNAERVPKRTPKSAVLLEVPDPLRALGEMAFWHRNRFCVRMVAVTGSVGKTTTKDLLASILSQQGSTLKSPGNLNAEIGLPLTLLQLDASHQSCVVEMGMRGPGQIRYLARLTRPDVAVITNVGLAHLEYLGSRDAIAEAKAEVLDFLPNGGFAILGAGDDYYQFLRSRVPAWASVRTFQLEPAGRDSVAGTYLGPAPRPDSRHRNDQIGARFAIRGAQGQAVRWSWIPLPGRHNVANALAAAAAANAMGLSWQRINRGLLEAQTAEMRMTLHRLRDGSVLLDDAYNASSPDAMLAALEVLQELPGLRKMAVLGSMLELGPASEAAHREVGEAVGKAHPQFVVTIGDQAGVMAETALAAGMPPERVARCRTNEEALEVIRGRRRPGDVILVKGSRGMAMEGIVGSLVESGTR